MLKVINHIQAYQGKVSEGKHLKFKVSSHPSRSFDDHLVVRVDTGADVNCMNETTCKVLFPEVKLSVCPHEKQNFRNSVGDISIPGQFHTYLQFKRKKYENNFIITNANDCPNLLSHDANFRMGILKPCYPRSMLLDGENVPHFKKMSSSKMSALSGPSNVFQILNELQNKQKATNWSENPVQPISFRTTTPSKSASKLTMTATNTQENISSMATQVFSIKTTAQSRSSAPSAHVHKPPRSALKLGVSVAMSNVQILTNGRTSVMRTL